MTRDLADDAKSGRYKSNLLEFGCDRDQSS